MISGGVNFKFMNATDKEENQVLVVSLATISYCAVVYILQYIGNFFAWLVIYMIKLLYCH